MTSHNDPGDEQRTIRQCDFCGRTAPPEEPFGEAHTYVNPPAADGGLADGGVETVRICLGCAFSQSSPPDEQQVDHEYAARCDLCGDVGFSTGGCVEGSRYRLEDLMTWSVEIRGFEGNVTVCRNCTPIKNWDLFRREGVEYVRESALEVPTRAEAGRQTEDHQIDRSAPTPDQATLGTWAEQS